jgi:hypothetical protein
MAAPSKFKELIFEKCIVVLCIMNADNRQYGSMKVELAASFTKGHDEYPDALDKAIGYLDTHKLNVAYKDYRKQHHESMYFEAKPVDPPISMGSFL